MSGSIEMEKHSNPNKVSSTEVKDAFDFYDRDSDGFLSGREAIQAARSIGFAPSNEVVTKQLKGEVKYELKQFEQLLKELKETRISNDDLKNAFASFDFDHKGRISLKDFQHALLSLGPEPLNQTEIDNMTNDIIADNDGMITLEEMNSVSGNRDRQSSPASSQSSEQSSSSPTDEESQRNPQRFDVTRILDESRFVVPGMDGKATICVACNYHTKCRGNMAIHLGSEKHRNNARKLDQNREMASIGPPPPPVPSEARPNEDGSGVVGASSLNSTASLQMHFEAAAHGRNGAQPAAVSTAAAAAPVNNSTQYAMMNAAAAAAPSASSSSSTAINTNVANYVSQISTLLLNAMYSNVPALIQWYNSNAQATRSSNPGAVLSEHVNRAAPSDLSPRFRCRPCGLNFTAYYDVIVHYTTSDSHRQNMRGVSSGVFVCFRAECSSYFQSEQELTAHFEVCGPRDDRQPPPPPRRTSDETVQTCMRPRAELSDSFLGNYLVGAAQADPEHNVKQISFDTGESTLTVCYWCYLALNSGIPNRQEDQLHILNVAKVMNDVVSKVTSTTTTSSSAGICADALDSLSSQRRARTVLSAQQMECLKRHFVENQNPRKPVIDEIALEVGLSDKVVKVWFQNRRAKVRKRPILDDSADRGQTLQMPPPHPQIKMEPTYPAQSAVYAAQRLVSMDPMQHQMVGRPQLFAFQPASFYHHHHPNGIGLRTTAAGSAFVGGGGGGVGRRLLLNTNHQVPNADQVVKKPRRVRTQMTQLQLKVMRGVFIDFKTPTMAECERMGALIKLAKRSVQVWFQNSRAKEKRQPEDMEKELQANMSLAQKTGGSIPDGPWSSVDECTLCRLQLSGAESQRDHVFSEPHLKTLMNAFSLIIKAEAASSARPDLHEEFMRQYGRTSESSEYLQHSSAEESGASPPPIVKEEEEEPVRQETAATQPAPAGTPISSLYLPQCARDMIGAAIECNGSVVRYFEDNSSPQVLISANYRSVTKILTVGFACKNCRTAFPAFQQLEAHVHTFHKPANVGDSSLFLKIEQAVHQCVGCQGVYHTIRDYIDHADKDTALPQCKRTQ